LSVLILNISIQHLPTVMKRLWNVLLLFLALISVSHAQIDRTGQAWRDHIYNRSATQVSRFTPFNLASGPDLSQFNPEITYLKVNAPELDRLLTENPADLQITIPNSNGSPLTVDLYPSGILADNFSAWTPDPNAKNGVQKFNNPHNGLHYWGTVAGSPNTTVAFSFFPNEIMGIVMTPQGNYNIGILNTEKAGDKNSLYALFNDRLSTTKNPFSCQVADAPVKMKQEDINPFASTTCKVVRVYFEADKHLHDLRGNVANTVTFITGFFNVVGVVYANEAISLELGDIKVWNTPDPYLTFTTTTQFLDEFRINQIPPNPFTWNLAHLVSTRLNIGGLAYLNVLCSGSRGNRSGFSAIFNSFQPLPAYSWTVNVICHEMGHNFSSPHTHNCGWPGGAIDGCEVTEGGCFRPPNANPGTIMSYCHTQTSIDLNLGFGPFPGNRIRRAYQNATCLPTSTVTATITSPTSPFRLCQGNNVTLNAQTCTGCTYQWQRNGTNINGATSASHTTSQEGTYTVVVRRFACQAISEPVSVVLITAPCNPANGNVTGGVTLACGSTPSGTLTLAGHTGTILRWESSTDNFATVTTINSTTTTITYPVLNQTTCYRAVINNGGTTFSQPNCIVIATPPSVTAGIDARSLCQDSSATLWATAPNAISFSWQPTNGLNNPNISHPFLTLAISTTYTVTVTDNNGCTNSASVVVTLSPTAGQATVANGALCIGDQAVLTLGTPINGSITWQQQANCTGAFNTATGTGVNTPNFTSNAYTQSGSMCYRARLTQGTCVYVSNVVTVSICGDVRFTCTNLTYNNLFNTWNPTTPMANTCVGGNAIGWVNDSSVPGWYTIALGAGSMFFNAQSGGCGAEGFNAYGANGSGERDLGTWSRTSNPTNTAIGSKCRNNTGGTITTIRVQYTGEQWFRGTTANILDRLDFQYSIDATALNNGTWTDHDPLDFITPQRTNLGPINGNVAPQRTVFDQTITGLSIPNGATFWLRWVDFNQNGLTDQDMMGIDDLTYTVTFTGGLTAPTSVTGPVEHCANEDQTYTVTPVTGNGTVRYNWTIPGGCTGWSLQSPNNTASTTMVIRAGSGNCSGVTVTATDDCGTSAPFNFNITLGPCLPSNGGTLSAAQTICSGQTPAQLSVTGQVGTILRWESSTNCPGFASPTTIVNTNSTFTPPALAQTTCFRVVVQNNNRPSANSNVVTITVNQPGTGGTVGNAQTVCAGDNVNLNLTGHSGTIVRWESSTDNFVTVTTINNLLTSYTFTASLPTTAYRAVIQNSPCLAVFSTPVTVTVNNCVSNGGNVTANQTVCAGTAAAMLTLSGHTGNVVRWESSTDNFVTTTSINNTNTTYNPGILAQTTCFRAAVLNTPPEVFSTSACVTIVQPGTAGAVGIDQTVCASANVTLNLTGHSGTIIRWESSTDNFVTVTTISNTNATYSFTAGVTTRYRAVIQNSPCAAIFSTSANITVNPCGSNGGNVTADQTVCTGSPANTLTLSGHTGNVVRWESSTNNFTTVTTINNTNTTYNPGILAQTTCFRAVVVNTPPEANSTPACITVDLVSLGGTVSAPQTICTGSLASALTLTGQRGNVLRWESSTDNFATITTINNTNSTLNPGVLLINTCYRAVVQNGVCPPANSTPVCITVDLVSLGGTVSAPQTICTGNPASALTLTGQRGNVLRWESSTDNFATITTINNTNSTLNPGVLPVSTCYRAVVQNGVCPPANSTPVCITVDLVSLGGTVSAPQTICTGNPASALTLTGQRGNVLRWESSTDNFATITTINNTNSTLNPGVLPVSTCYRAVVQNGVCPPANSTPVCITVTNNPPAGAVSSDMTVCSDANTGTLTLTGHVGNVLYWESSTDNFLTVTTINNTMTTYIFNNLTTNTRFRAQVQSPGCATVASASVFIVVTNPPLGGTVTADQTLCPGKTPSMLRLINFAGAIVRWESSTDNFVTVTTINNTVNTYNPGVVMQTTRFRAVVQNPCSTVYSLPANITIISGNGGNLSQDMTLCSIPGNGTLTVTGYTGTIQAWEGSTDNFVTVQPYGVNTPTFNFTNLTTTTKFRVRVLDGSCLFYSNAIQVTILPSPKGGTMLSNQTICEGQNASVLILTSFSGNVIRWESSTDNFTTITTINNTTAVYNPNPVAQTTSFRAVVGRSGCADQYSSVATITFGNGAVGGTLNSDQTICSGTAPSALTLTGYSGTILRWESSGDNFLSLSTISNTLSSYQPPLLTQSRAYRVVVSGGSCGNVYSSIVNITVNGNAEGGQVNSDQTVCSGSPGAPLTLVGYTGNVVRWESSTDNFALNITPIVNNTNTHLPGIMTGTTWFRAVVQQAGCAEVNSGSVRIQVNPGPVGGNVINNQTVCSGQMPTILTVLGFSGTIVQWESSTDNFVTVNVIPNTNSTYNPGILANTTAFRVRISNGSCPDAYATPATITVVSNIAVGGSVTSDLTLCSNDANTYTLNLSGQTGSIIRWEASEDNFLSISSFANTNTSHQFAGLRNTTKFRAVVGVPGCNVVYSTPVTITILSPQENGILANVGNGQVSCANNTGTLMLNNYNGTISHWESSTDNFVTITNIPNNTNSYAYSVVATTRFRVAINHPVCGLIYSPYIEISPGISINLQSWRECNATGKIVATATGGSLPYIYTISPQAGLQSQVGIFTGLPVGTYTITVRDRFNCTASATIAIPGTVTPPRITTVTTIGNTAARVIWDIVAPGGVNVVYQVQHRPVGSPTWSTPLQVNSNIAIISGLIPNTQYEVQVRVRCLPSTIWGGWSPSTIFRTAVREGWIADDAVSNLQIYPNPNKGSFVIQLNSPKSEVAQIHIYDMQGKMIHSLETVSDENTINLPEITSGVYLVRVIQCGQSKTVKMVVE